MKYVCKLYNRKKELVNTYTYDYLPDRIRVPKKSIKSYVQTFDGTLDPIINDTITVIDYRVSYKGKVLNSEIAEYEFHEAAGPRTPVEILEDFLKES